MPRRLAMLALVGTVTFLAACSSDPGTPGTPGANTGGAAGTGGATGMGGAAGTGGATADGGDPPAVYPPCNSAANGLCAPSGFPFVKRAFPATESCLGDECLAPTPPGQSTVHLSQPEAGTLCLSGTVLPGTAGARFNIGFTVTNQAATKVLATLNAKAFGITQVAFTIDRLPAGGLLLETGTIIRRDCPDGLPTCILFGFQFPVITKVGANVESFADVSSSSGVSFDPTSISHMSFTVSEPGAYDFCLRDFRFLNANGAPVPEPRGR